MSIDNVLLISVPTVLLLLLFWYVVKSEKPHEEVESDEEDQMLYDPLTGKKITLEEAEAGMSISEEEEEELLKQVDFEDVELESDKENSEKKTTTPPESEV
ncbi:MAG TPA: hypothetical protein DEP18_06085 [Flavobacteriales bacterium]|nr:hypothetical protein [Flavobacteriales bacterium]HRE74498.1 hypothetical protein [Flavobacteriales bacterium]HRE96331.1 hypothetical protein [Flavobacteriales bacterium]HRJ36349.1 hypothetical protein [Flavobacteriales bacterium]HRJ37835.1 hypothetical protein [Flavobacteriales bacterium]